MKVPDILLSGDHGKIREWRRMMSLKRTLEKRPALINLDSLSEQDRKLMMHEGGTGVDAGK